MEMPYFQLPYSQVCLSALLILINGAISVFLTFGLERRLPLAAVAFVAQLLLIGPVFDRFLRPNRCEFVLALMAALTLIAGTAAVRRTDIRYPGIWLASVASVRTSSWATGSLALFWGSGPGTRHSVQSRCSV